MNTTGQDNWLTLIELMGNPDWTREPRFRDLMKIDESDWPEGDRHLGAWLANYTRDELLDLEIGRNLRVGIAPVRDIGEVSRDPSLDGFFTGIPGDDGQAVRFPGLAYHFSNWAPPLSRRAPGLGEDNVLVFCELLGVPRHELVRMYRQGLSRMEPTRNGGLADYRVVDLSRTLAGPVPSMFLADMGAQVIKVETRRYLDAIRRGRLVEPEKSEVEQHPQAHNVWRGKLGITLDIAQPEARSILSRL